MKDAAHMILLRDSINKLGVKCSAKCKSVVRTKKLNNGH